MIVLGVLYMTDVDVWVDLLAKHLFWIGSVAQIILFF